MKHPYDFESEATALVARMSIDEKASLMSGSSFWHLQPLAQYDLPPIMVSDGPHGLRKQGNQADHMGLTASVPATCFPTAVTLASSWDRALIAEVGAAIGRECQAEEVSVLLAPGVNIKRSPLCGRNFEYYSEDQAGELKDQFSKYLSVFKERKLHVYLRNQPKMTLEYVCFHKNWNDKSEQGENQEELLKLFKTAGPYLYDILDNYTLFETQFYDQ